METRPPSPHLRSALGLTSSAPEGYYRPDLLAGQREFLRDTSPRLFYVGAFGAGKTHVLCLKALVLSLRYERNFILLCRKTFSSMRHTTMRKFLELAAPFDHEVNKSEGIVTLLDSGSQVLFGGLEDPARLGSLEVTAVGVDESPELDEADWTMLEGRLRHQAMPFRQIFAVGNPCPPMHWQHKLFMDRGAGTVIRSNTLQNRHLPPDYLVRLDNFQGIFRQRFVEGLCVGAEGLVYDCFRPERHVIDPFTIPRDWPRYGAIDFGYANPFVMLWAAEQPHEPTEDYPYPKGTLFVYREWYRSRMLCEEHALRINALSVVKREGEIFTEPPAYPWADHDAEDRATLLRHGVPTRAAHKEVSVGIQAVYRRLAGTEAEAPSLYFFRDLSVDVDQILKEERKPTGLLDEIGGYKWEPEREGRSAKEEPRKENDHAMDALRYLVLGVEKSSRNPVSFV